MAWYDRYKTICSKHDYIESVLRDAVGLLDSASKESESDSIKDTIDDALGKIGDARTMVDIAKDDGQRMENGLTSKRERIKDLENEVFQLTQQLESVREELKVLEAQP